MKTLGVRIGFVTTVAMTALAFAGGCGGDKGETGGAGGTTSSVTSAVASTTHATSSVQSGATTHSATTNNSAAATTNSATSTTDSASASSTTSISASATTGVTAAATTVSALQASVSTAIAASSSGSGMNVAPCHNQCANDAGCQATPINPGATCATCVQDQANMGVGSACTSSAGLSSTCQNQPDCQALVTCVITTMNQATCEMQHPTGFAILQPLVFASCGDCG